MNIFDAGGITTAIAVIATIIIGTGIFALINKIFDVWYHWWYSWNDWRMVSMLCNKCIYS